MIRRTNFPSQVVGTAAFVQVSLGGGTTINQDSSRFGIGAGDTDTTDVKLGGRYGFYGKIRWEPVFAGLTHLAIGTSGPWTYWPIVAYSGPTDLDDVGQVVEIYVEADLPGGTSNFDLKVRQESGANQTLEGAMFQITYLGATTNQDTEYDDF